MRMVIHNTRKCVNCYPNSPSGTKAPILSAVRVLPVDDSELSPSPGIALSQKELLFALPQSYVSFCRGGLHPMTG